ncbi:MAG TPA: AsmA family protein [Tepidisphaeraceae bacterium]|jgi:hypothetical protein|nr:AsmA family protein [Tepidisphaeraceae bacterium]
MKKMKWIALGLLALVVVVVVVVLVNLNSIVRRTVETQSTANLKVPASLESAAVSILGGDVSLRDYKVGSPTGYNAEHMLTLGALDVDTSWGGLRSDPVSINEIAIANPTLVLEMNGKNFNIKKFIENLPQTDDAPANEEPLKLIINKLNVTGAKVLFRPDVTALAALPGGLGEGVADKIKQEYVLNIPDLSMADIGTGEGNANGAAVKDVVTQLITTLAGRASESQDLPPELRMLLSGDLSSMTAMLKEKGMAEASKRIAAVTDELKTKLTNELGPQGAQVLDALKNPDTAKDAARGAVESAKGEAKGAATRAVNDLLGGLGDKKTPTTRP